MSFCWDVDSVDASQRLVLLAYADHASDDGTGIYPAVATVARKTGLSERQVQRVTRSLEAKGLLLADGEGPKRTRRWRMPVLGGDTMSPLMVTPMSPSRVTCVSPEPSLEPSKNHTARPKRPSPAPPELLNPFLQITGLPLPVVGQEISGGEWTVRWVKPLQALLRQAGDRDRAIQAMALAVRDHRTHRPNPLTIEAPQSIFKMARGHLATLPRATAQPADMPLETGRH